MKQQPAKCAVDEWGNLVNAEDFRSPSFWKLYCFHCSGPVVLVFVPNGQASHFLHDETSMASDDFIACDFPDIVTRAKSRKHLIWLALLLLKSQP